MKLVFVIAFFLACSGVAFAQTGPGGVGNAANNVLWLSADYGVYSDAAGTTPATSGGNVALWTDRSGNDTHAVNSTTSAQPDFEINVANSLPVIRFTAGNGDRLLSDGVATGNAASIWAVARWFSLPSQNPGIIQAASAAFSSATGDKVIGMWVNSASQRIWGRGIQSDGTQQNFPQNVTTAVNTFYGFLNYYDGVAQMTQYVDGSLAGSVAYDGTLRSWSAFGIGRQAGESWDGDIAEVIAFNTAVNEAQRIIINNYLSAKYNLPLSEFDFYTMDDVGNGDYDHDVAGIGRVNALNQHTDARGSGIVRILNATNLDDDEFLIWGHDGGTLQASVTTGIPARTSARFERVWRASERGNVGNVDLQFDLTGLPAFAAMDPCDVSLQLGLLIDVDNDGDFSDQTPIFGATPVESNTYRFASVAGIGNATRFTLAVLNAPGTGPGGVGTTDGTSTLKLWYRPDSGVEVTGTAVDRWINSAGVTELDVAETGAERPTVVAGVNGFDALSFDGTNRLRTGLTLTTSNFVTNQASSFVVSRPDNSGQASCVYTTDPLETNRFANHIPWSNTVVFDIGDWNDPSARLEIAAPADITSRYSLWTYSANPTFGKQLYRDGVLLQSRPGTATYSSHATHRFNIGAHTSGSPGYQGDLAEMAIYTARVNTAQRVLIQNYFAAKYDLPLAENDIYKWDDAANGNFDFDVAGIGRVDGSNMHTDAQGTGIVRIFNASDLHDDEYMIWGHDNGPMVTVTTDVPPGVQGRLSRVWRVSETDGAGAAANVGTIDIQFDLSGLEPITASDLRLLIDHDGDGLFAEAGTIQKSGAIALACNRFVFQAIVGNEITHGDRFTVGTINLSQTPLPIELDFFTGRMARGSAQLAWVTLSEKDNHYFTVERSADGKHFSGVGTVHGSGTTREPTDYAFTDPFPPSGRLYYRLKQTDIDGAHSYSGVIMVDNRTSGTQLIAFPNPVASGRAVELRIRHTEYIDPTTVQVVAYDLMGKRIPISTEVVEGNLLRVQFGHESPSGVCVIRATSPELSTALYTRLYVR